MPSRSTEGSLIGIGWKRDRIHGSAEQRELHRFRRQFLTEPLIVEQRPRSVIRRDDKGLGASNRAGEPGHLVKS